jgi:GT2 family glycosyltransferase
MSVSIVVLSKYRDIFARFNESVQKFNPIQKVLIRTGNDIPFPDTGGWHVFTPEGEFNFARFANIGIKACFGDVMIVNDDVTFPDPQTVQRLYEAAYSSKTYGIVSPKIVGGGQVPQTDVPGGTIITTPHFLAFVCVYIKREVIDNIGFLDERYSDGYGYEDVDYCVTARKAGYELAVTGHTSIQHGYDRQSCSTSFIRTFQNGYGAAGARNRERFMAKWGGKPLEDIWNG